MRTRELIVAGAGAVALLAGGAFAGVPEAGKFIERKWGDSVSGEWFTAEWRTYDGEFDYIGPPPTTLADAAVFDIESLILPPPKLRASYTVTLGSPVTIGAFFLADDVVLDLTGATLNVQTGVVISDDQNSPVPAPTSLRLIGGALVTGSNLRVGQNEPDAAPATFTLETSATLTVGGNLAVRRAGVVDLHKGFNGAMLNGGRVKLRDGSATFASITGDFTQLGSTTQSGEVLPGGTLEMEVFSTSSFDRLQTSGSAYLDGTMVVRWDEKGSFPVGTEIPGVIRAGFVIFDQFDAVFFTPAFPDNRRFKVNYPIPAAGTGKFLTVDLQVVELPPQPDIGDGTQGASAITGRPVSAVSVDLNGDGFPDLAGAVPALVAANGTGTGAVGGGVVVVLNLGVDVNGDWLGFGPAATYLSGLGPVAIASGDLDADGDRDLAVVNPGNGVFPAGARVLLNDGAGVFTPFGAPGDVFADADFDPRGVAIGNFIADGGNLPDLAVTSLDGPGGTGQVVVFQNQGVPVRAWSGLLRFQRTLLGGTDPGTVQPGGLDNPKEVDDMAIGARPGSDGSNLIVLINANTPTPDPMTPLFDEPQNVTVGGGPEHLALIDMDRDGDTDIVSSNNNAGTVSIVQNLGTNEFGGVFSVQTLPSGPESGPVAPLDIDGDTDNDIAVVVEDPATPGTRLIKVLRNDTDVGNVGGPLVFAEGQLFGEAAGPLFILPGDADLDGDADILAFTDPPAAPTEQATAFLNVLCRTDLDGSGGTDLADLTRFLADFGFFVEPGSPGDFDLDGRITTADLVVVLGEFGSACR